MDSETTQAKAKQTAKKRAQYLLRQKNKKKYVVEFLMPGSVEWIAGRVFQLDESWGRKWQGCYQIDSTVHRCGEDGYTTQVRAHKRVGY